MWWSRSSPALSRWNSFSSETPGHSGPLSLMDVLSIWKDDPEDVLLDLGFGRDEPGLSGRIPARFINNQSQARGINLQVFLEAQKNRLDLENPEVNNRFRQLEVFHQVTSAFSSLVESSPRVTQEKELTPEALERRRRISMLFKHASKKSLSQIRKNITTTGAPEPLQPPPSLGDKKPFLKRVKPGLQEMVCLSPLEEEQGSSSVVQSPVASSPLEGADGPSPMREGHPTALQWKKNQVKLNESFEMDEIQSLDESIITGSSTGGAEVVMRTNSCQSDSSGFQEELFILPPSQQPTPESELMKALSGLSGGISERPGSPSPDDVFDPSPFPVSLCLPKSEAPADNHQSSPSPLDEQAHEYTPLCSSSPELQNTFPLKSSTPPSPALSTSLSPESPTMQAYSSLIKGSGLIKTEAGDAPTSHLLTHSCNSEAAASSAFSKAPPAVPPPPSPYLDDPFFASLAESDSSSGSPGNTRPDWTEVALYEHRLPANDSFTFPYPSSPNLNPDFHHPSLSQCPKDGKNDSLIPRVSGLPDSPINGPLAPLAEKLSFQNSNPSLDAHDPDSLIDPEYLSQTEQSISQKDRSHSHDDVIDPALASHAQDFIRFKMDHIPLGEVNAEGEGEVVKNCDSTPTRESLVHISETESPAEGSRLRALSPSSPMESNTKELRKVCQTEMKVRENPPPTSLVLPDDIPEIIDDIEPKDLIEIESLDLVFHTSVDNDSEGEPGDVDAFFQQVDNERIVYWAEPVQVINPNPEDSESLEASGGSPGDSLLLTSPTASDSISSRTGDMPLSLSPVTTMGCDSANHPSQSTISDLKSSTRTVSVQMPSSPSSHIVNRTDIPYMTDSKPSLLPITLPLDTSTPFRAVQSWTDLQLQRIPLTRMCSHNALLTNANEETVSKSLSEKKQKPAHIFSSSPLLPLLSNNQQSHDCFYGTADYRTVDEGPRPDDELDKNAGEDKEKLLEGNQETVMVCYCIDDHLCTICTQKGTKRQTIPGNLPFSMTELEETMWCLQQFCSVFTNMEEQLSEEQTAVYRALSDQDRKKVWDIEELRHAVKQEARELEMRLNELAHDYDGALKRKIHRLLDEQSLFYSKLRVPLPGAAITSPGPAPHRTVASQRSLLPWIPMADMQSSGFSSCNTSRVDSTRPTPPGSDGTGCSSTKTEKTVPVGFLQILMESLRRSVKKDSVE